jgi:hypothetical protein
MDLFTDYEKAQQLLINLKDQETNLDNLVNIIKESYQEKLRLLEDEQREKLHSAERTRDTKVEIIRDQREPLTATVSRVQKILKIMEIIKDNPQLHPIEIYTYSDKDEQGNYIRDKRKIYIDPIQVLRSDMYGTFNLYIVPNDKPKNKYSLIIRGSTIFDNMFPFRSQGYIFKVNDNAGISITIKDAPTVKELLAYIDRPVNMQKIMGMIPEDLITIIEEHKEATELLKDVRWQVLYLESRKHYYEENVHNGTEDPEYKEILKQIRELKSR